MLRLLAAGVALTLLLGGCRLAPTQTRETQKREFALLVNKSQRPLKISEQTVVLDTRSAFDYGLNRIENSVHMPWVRLAEKEESGELLRDPRKAAQRLALAGLSPATPVIVVGHGRKGAGEEGRLAWNLLYLGFTDVQTATVELFRANWTQVPTPPIQNVPEWMNSSRVEMLAGIEDVKRVLKHPSPREWLIDVRAGGEYSGSESPALRLAWTNFFTGEGRPDPTVVSKLESMGVQRGDLIILISNRGVRSGAAAYALTALGFSKVQNFVGGWRALTKG